MRRRRDDEAGEFDRFSLHLLSLRLHLLAGDHPSRALRRAAVGLWELLGGTEGQWRHTRS